MKLRSFPNPQEGNTVELHYGNYISCFVLPFSARVVSLLLHKFLTPKGHLIMGKYANTQTTTYPNKFCKLYSLIND